jgi:hypothetical protein
MTGKVVPSIGHTAAVCGYWHHSFARSLGLRSVRTTLHVSWMINSRYVCEGQASCRKVRGGSGRANRQTYIANGEKYVGCSWGRGCCPPPPPPLHHKDTHAKIMKTMQGYGGKAAYLLKFPFPQLGILCHLDLQVQATPVCYKF